MRKVPTTPEPKATSPRAARSKSSLSPVLKHVKGRLAAPFPLVAHTALSAIGAHRASCNAAPRSRFRMRHRIPRIATSIGPANDRYMSFVVAVSWS